MPSRELGTGATRRAAWVLATALCLLSISFILRAGPSAEATTVDSVPVPKVQGPILPAGGISFLGSTLFPPSSVGYEESEFFLSGTATAYKSATPLTKNGRWHVTRQTTASYTTRAVVYRPIDPKKFDGTVVVEWLNVSGGIDAPAAWLNSHVQMVRDGMVYIGIDAQSGGLSTQPGSVAASAGQGGLEQADPARYGALHHPGDSFSYSIYEQAGAAVHADAAKLFAGLKPKRVLALGESQSAFRLVTYLDALQPTSSGIYNAYVVYSRGGDGAALSQSPQRTITTPTPTFIRTDLHVPVLLFETEADLLVLDYYPARQPSTKDIREWEVGGSAHDDTYGLLYARGDTGNGAADAAAFGSQLDPPADPIPGIVSCASPINAGSHTYELRAAMAAVNRWVATGHAPPSSPRLEVASSGRSFVTDANGNALGGIRTPQVSAPVAKLSGLGQPGASLVRHPGNVSTVSGSALCSIFGTTVPLSAAKLASLYPTHQAFVAKWDAATAADVKAGYLLPADARTLDHVAAASNVGG